MENRRSHRLQIIVIYVCFVMIMALWVDIFLDRYSRYNEEVLYEERLNQMKKVTTAVYRSGRCGREPLGSGGGTDKPSKRRSIARRRTTHTFYA